MNPTFLAIWGVEPWQMGPNRRWKRSRNYYRVRSVVRMAFWIPVTTFTFVVGLGVLSQWQ